MKHLIIYAHSNPQSFNAAIKNTISSTLLEMGEEVRVRDLYAMQFNPILTTEEINLFYEQQYAEDVLAEHEQINWADHLYFVYPTWWYGLPAILKGYIDRVFCSGFAFRYSKQGPIGLLTGKKAFVFQTAADPEEALLARDLISAMQKTIDVGILEYCGLEVREHKYLHSVHHVSDESRQQYLQEVQEAVMSGFAKST